MKKPLLASTSTPVFTSTTRVCGASKLAIGLLFAFAAVPSAFAANTTWTGAVDADWSNIANWDTGAVPTSGDDVYINLSSGAVIGTGKAVATNQFILGKDAGDAGDLTVAGANASLSSGGRLTVGYNGSGTLTIKNGGSVKTTGGFNNIEIGAYSGSSGIVIVDGSGSTFTSSGQLLIGNSGSGNGTLIVKNGGSAKSAAETALGQYPGSNGMLVVDGIGSTFTSGGVMAVGWYGNGTLIIKNGGSVQTEPGARIYIGFFSGSRGTVIVGSGSSLISAMHISVSGGSFLGGTGTVRPNSATALKVYSTATLSAGDTTGAIGTLNIIGGINMDAGAIIAVDYNNAGAVAGTNHDLIKVSGDANVIGSVTLGGAPKISLSSLAGGNITTARTIISATHTMSTLASTTDAILLNGLDITNSRAAGSSVTLKTTGKNLQITALTITGNTNKPVTWSGSGNTNWDIATINWTDDGNSGTPIKFLDGDAVAFNTTTTTSITILGTQKTVAQMRVNNAENLTINGNIVGDGTTAATTLGFPSNFGLFEKTGAGALTLNGTSTFKGNVSIGGGSVNLDGNGSTLTSNATFVIGDNGNGTLNLKNGGEAISTGSLIAGAYGNGTLNITNGGKATVAWDTSLGYLSGCSGTATVDGAGSTLSSDYLYIGYMGTGILNLTNGGKATAAGAIFIGDTSGSTGSITVGTSSTLTSIGGNIYVGGHVSSPGGTGLLAGTGTVTVNNGSGLVKVYSTGTLSAGDTVGSIGTLTINGNVTLAAGAQLIIDINGTSSDQLIITGALTLDPGAQLQVVVTGAAPTIGTEYQLISGFKPTGTFNDGVLNLFANGIEFTLDYRNNGLFLTAIPEPSTYALIGGLTALIGAVVFRRRRQ